MGTALFEKSSSLLLQDRLAELDREAGRPPPEEEDLPGKWRRIHPVRFANLFFHSHA